MFPFNKSTDEIKIIVTKKDEKIVSEILEITRDGKQFFIDCFDHLNPDLQDIHKDIFQRFFNISDNEERSNIIKMFQIESKTKIHNEKYFNFIGQLHCNNYDNHIIGNNFELFMNICESFSNEFKWKLFVAILNFEKDHEQPQQDPLKYLIHLLTNKKYEDFLIYYNKYNGDLKQGYIFNFCLLTYAKMTLRCPDIIKFLEDIHSGYVKQLV